MENNPIAIEKIEPTYPKLFTYLHKLLAVIAAPVKTIRSTGKELKLILLLPFVIVTSILPYMLRTGFLRADIANTLMQANVPTDLIHESVNKVIAYNMIAVPTVALVSIAFWAAVMYGISKLLHGEGSLKQYIAIYGYTFSINFLYVCFIIIQSYFTGKSTIDISLYKLLSMAINNLNGFGIGFLKEIDPFRIWKYSILFLGVLHVGKLSKGKAYGVVGIMFAMSGTIRGLGEVLTLIISKLM